MDFDKIYKSFVPSRSSILELVDEYTLYCFYTGYESISLNKAYNCPFRIDKVPSFSIFRTNQENIGVEYYWKDHKTRESGDIFKLIQKIERLDSRYEVFSKINEDFGLDYNLPGVQEREKITLYQKPKESIIKIRIAAIPFTLAGKAYWKQFEVDQQLLDLYNTTQIKWYWSFFDQQAPYSVLDPTFAYRIGEYYQVYSPTAEKVNKFRNDLPENYFFGYLQLPKTGDKLVIDKSCKDVIFCRRLGFNAVCGKSETTMIPHYKMVELLGRFKEVYITLDPDEAGRNQTEKYLELYPSLKPRFLDEAKDKTDLCIKVGFDQARSIINNLLN